MKKITSIVFGVIIITLFFYAFFSKRPDVDIAESYQSYLDGRAIFIDVREANEIKDGMIKGALWVPMSKIKSNKEFAISEITKMAEGKEIFIYCKSGNRAGKVKKILQKAGVEAHNMRGYSSLVSKKLPTQLPNLAGLEK